MGVINVLFVVSFCMCHADRDDKKWVWDQNNRNSNSRSYQNPNSRYNVFEETDDYVPAGSSQFYPSTQTQLINQRPPPVYSNRPPVSGAGFIPNERPGGVYAGGINRPNYGGQAQYHPEEANPGVLTGPVPSWVKQGPIKNFDKCKCSEKFNCNSPGISYGHCDVGKQYCCYSTTKDLGGPIPSKPVHSIENGILVGPGGPVDPIPGVNNHQRPPKQLGSGFYRPAGYQGSQGSLGGFYGGNQGGYREPNEYSPANGVLVGPGGPYDGPFGLGRSAKSSVQAKNS
ncbi:hypothetical protein D910_11364 [Dendroctonus ponderosae]